MTLTIERFVDFVRDVHGIDGPFPWQRELCRKLLDGDGWPDLIDVPTGLGKTSVLDVAVFAMAAGSTARLPRRIFLCIDRRSVVDEAYHHALAIAKALNRAKPNTVAALVAEHLRALTGGAGRALEVCRMRGGVTWEWRWLRRPDQPAVVIGTVDQLGSRMFFRGYGVGERLYPIDAALVGTDSLFVLDEAHLAEPFLATLRTAQRFDHSELPLARPTIVSMSATPNAYSPRSRTLSFDVDAHLHHPIARERLTAAKTAHLLRCPPAEIPSVMAKTVLSLAAQPGVETVGVVANTVARARSVFEQLRDKLPDRVALLTGRNRTIDRAQIESQWLPQFDVHRTRGSGEAPYVLVATQTIEVGMNLDFDALVTESAAWDALVQRLGRLNRLGVSSADRCRAVVIAADRPAPDPVYGPATDAAAAWLAQQAGETLVNRARTIQTTDLGSGLDVSPLALRALAESIPAETHTVPPAAPMLAPGILDTWSRTSPIPDPDVPVAPFLHGLDQASATVQVAWRADLAAEAATPGAAIESETLLPPTAEETIELPLPAVQRWLTDAPEAANIADVEGRETTATDAPVAPGRAVLRIAATGGEWIPPRLIRPGDTLLVPTAYGGLDEWGWAPTSSERALDCADLTRRGNHHVIRLDRRTIPAYLDTSDDTASSALKRMEDLLSEDDEPVDLLAAARATAADIAALPPGAINPRLQQLLTAAAQTGQIHSAHPSAIWLRVPIPTHERDRAYGDLDDENSMSSGKPVPLDIHHTAVAQAAGAFAANLGLPAHVTEAVRLAAGWHDLGKLDPRFQVMLHRGNRYAALAAPAPLAKSGMNPADRAAFRRAQRDSGYPAGARHELLSARIARAALVADHHGADADLITHLVASHHGRSRPLLESVHDPAPPRVTTSVDDIPIDLLADPGIDWTSPARFHRLQRRYGRWGLALLETIVRLADISCSEQGT